MDKPAVKGDGNDIGDCSDDDLFKGSDDAVNVVKSSKHTSNIHSFLPYKMIYICTMVSVIGIVVTVVMFGVISNDDQKIGYQLTTEMSRMSKQLESLSSKIDSHTSKPDGQQTCEKINNSYIYYAFQEEIRRLKDELQKTKSSKDYKKTVFQLSKVVSRMSNQLESLSKKIDSQSSRTDGPQTCEKINRSYLNYAFQAENRRLKDELQKTKSRIDDKKNGLQLSKVVSRMSNQLESLSSKIDRHNSSPDGTQTGENINTSYLYYAFQEENRRLKDELQKTKSRKDSITCADTDNKPNQQDGRKEQSRFGCNLVSSVNNIYGWVVANRSLSLGSSDNFNLIIKFELLYPEIPDNDKLLFEFGLTTLADHLKFNHPAIIIRGKRCEKEPGMCLYVIDNALTRLEAHVFEQLSDYMQGQLTLELHKSYFVLMSNQKNIYISNMLNLSSDVKLWPVFRFYNTHLINISQTIISENNISFNRTTVDQHFFVSEDNSTISNRKLQHKRTSVSGWGVIIMSSETVLFIASTCFFMINDKSKDRFVQISSNISFVISFLLCLPLSLYYLYMNWSLHLLLVASACLGNFLYELKYVSSKTDLVKCFFAAAFFYSPYIVVFLKRSDIIYVV